MEVEIRTAQDLTSFNSALQAKFTGDFKPLAITVKQIKDEVSRRQQRYLFGIVYPALKQGFIDKGYEIQNLTCEQFDYFMREMFFFDVVKTSKGDKKIPKRLAFGKGKKEEVRKYIDELLMTGSKLGMYITSPDKDMFE
jgi:hypothetical protein